MIRGQSRSRPWWWIAGYLASAAAIALLKITQAINQGTAFILFAAATGLVVCFAFALSRQRGGDKPNAAIVRYTKGIAVSSMLYVLGLGAAITLDNRHDLEGMIAFFVAMMPVLPILGMIWAMARYLREEQDEYLRYRAMIASLAGLGLVLALGSFWGFLETFGLAPHVPGWWTVPIWAIGLGLGQAWMALRDRTGGGL